MFQTAELQDEYGSASSDWQLAEVQTPQAAVEAALHAALDAPAHLLQAVAELLQIDAHLLPIQTETSHVAIAIELEDARRLGRARR